MTSVFSICLEQWNMTRAQTLEFLITVTRPCTSTATRLEKLCASFVMKATSSLATSSSTASLAIPLSGVTHHRSAKASSSVKPACVAVQLRTFFTLCHINVHGVIVFMIYCVWLNLCTCPKQWPTTSFWTITSWKVNSFFPSFLQLCLWST